MTTGQESSLTYRQRAFLISAGLDPDRYNKNDLKVSGVVDKYKKTGYKVDNQDRDCFLIYAKGLNIVNSDRSEYWEWTTDSTGIEVAKAVRARYLEVRGSFQTRQLSPKARYKVSLWLRMDAQLPQRVRTMGRQTVNLKLTGPGTHVEKQELLPDDGEWRELVVGYYDAGRGAGQLNVTMWQEFQDWRGGLVIKSVEIKPET